MARDDRATVHIQVDDEDDSDLARPLPDSAFCIALIGDFGGHAARAGSVADRAAHRFDRDDVDDVMARVAPELHTDAAGAPERIRFRSIDDFHPDALYHRVGVFGALRDLRRRLAERGGAAAIAQVLTREAPEDLPPVSAAGLTSGSSLLDQMLGDAPSSAKASPPQRPDDLSAFVRRVVAPHLVADVDPQQAQLIEAAEAAVAQQMRALLHDASFQSVESAWRTAEFLARRLDTGSTLQLYLIDVSREELDRDLDAHDARDTELRRLLHRTARALPDGSRWSVLCGLYSLGDDGGDGGRAVSLARIAGSLGAAWISGAAPELAGVSDYAKLRDDDAAPSAEKDAWRAARTASTARWVGLAAPRFLLRLPYGAAGDSIDSFEFEEGEGNYLWGNSAALCALLLGEAFAEDGWRLRPGTRHDVTGLPLHTYRSNGEVASLPCAETWMTEDIVDRMMDRGVMPIASFRDSDTVRLVRFQSIAAPAAALAGPWT